MLRPGFFRREIEVALRVVSCGVVVGAFLLVVAWGHQQRRQAESWRELACSYRVADVSRRAPFLGLEEFRDPCGRLQSLGLEVRTSGLSSLSVRQHVGRP